MSKKSLFILLSLLVIVVAVIALSRRQESRKGVPAVVPVAQELKALSVSEVSEVEIKQGEETVKLEKQEGRWSVNGKRVDADQVEQALKSLLEAEYTGPVARARENFDKLEVGDKGLAVTFKAGEKSIELRIGKSGPTYDSSYVRLEGSDETYLASKSLRYLFEARPDFWQSKKIVDIDPIQVSRIVIREGSGEKKLYQKEGDTWTVVTGSTSMTTDEAMVKSILNAAHPLTASGLVSEEQDISAFEKEKARATTYALFDAAGKQLAAVVLLKREGEWWARAEGDDQIYRVPQYTVEALKVE